MSVRVKPGKRIIANVGIPVQRLRVVQLGIGYRYDSGAPIGTQEPAHAACVVPSPEIVVAGFVVSAFAGKVIFGGADAAQAKIVAEWQAGKAEQVIAVAVVRDLLALGAEPIVERVDPGRGALCVRGQQSPVGEHVLMHQVAAAVVLGQLLQILSCAGVDAADGLDAFRTADARAFGIEFYAIAPNWCVAGDEIQRGSLSYAGIDHRSRARERQESAKLFPSLSGSG